MQFSIEFEKNLCFVKYCITIVFILLLFVRISSPEGIKWNSVSCKSTTRRKTHEISVFRGQCHQKPLILLGFPKISDILRI